VANLKIVSTRSHEPFSAMPRTRAAMKTSAKIDKTAIKISTIHPFLSCGLDATTETNNCKGQKITIDFYN
jgi:hypothetical protein